MALFHRKAFMLISPPLLIYSKLGGKSIETPASIRQCKSTAPQTAASRIIIQVSQHCHKTVVKKEKRKKLNSGSHKGWINCWAVVLVHISCEGCTYPITWQLSVYWTLCCLDSIERCIQEERAVFISLVGAYRLSLTRIVALLH